MEPSSRARIERLRGYLAHGLTTSGPRARADLGLSDEADDRDVAHALVQILSAVDVAASTEIEATKDPRRSEPTRPVPPPGSSILCRLEAEAGEAIDVDLISDVSTLLAVLRAGNLRQRRAALRHLMRRMTEDEVTSAAAKRVTETLTSIRDVGIAYELSRARAELPGSVGRAARSESEVWRRLVDELEPRITAYWEGDEESDPLFEIPWDARAQLLLRTRDLPELVLAHLASAIEGSNGSGDLTRRRSLVDSLRHAAEPRLLPTLVGILREGSLRPEAARALAHIDDPRVRSLLRDEFRRAVLERERLVLAGALGKAGDSRGRPELLESLDRGEPEILLLTLEALECAGIAEDAERVVMLLEHDERNVVAAAVRCLGRISDGRALVALRALMSRLPDSAMRAEVEEARAAIEARVELLGEDLDDLDDRMSDELLVAAPTGPRLPLGQRIAARLEYIAGWFLLHLGAVGRSNYHFERALRFRPHWGAPLIAIGMSFARRGDYARALPAFRRAIEFDRGRVEKNPVVVRTAARSFLRRAEEVEREGRRDIASGLLGEVLTLDLRRAPSALRFELERVHRSLRTELST